MRTITFGHAMRAVVGAAMVGALLVPASAVAKGPGGGGKPGEEGEGKNLSVPAVFVGTNPYGLVCDGGSSDPTGDPLTGFFVDPLNYYYVQGINTWQAGCVENEPSASAAAEWGDNLGGDAKLKVGSPIRVEVGLLTANPGTLTGWDVIKLEDTLDRLSDYGTLATQQPDGSFLSNPVTPYPETRVQAVLARAQHRPKAPGGGSSFDGGSLRIERSSHEVYRHGELVALTRAEWGLLVALASAPRRVISRAELVAQIWGLTHEGDERGIDSHVKNLRHKLRDEDHRIVQTVVGFGYRFGLSADA